MISPCFGARCETLDFERAENSLCHNHRYRKESQASGEGRHLKERRETPERLFSRYAKFFTKICWPKIELVVKPRGALNDAKRMSDLFGEW